MLELIISPHFNQGKCLSYALFIRQVHCKTRYLFDAKVAGTIDAKAAKEDLKGISLNKLCFSSLSNAGIG